MDESWIWTICAIALVVQLPNEESEKNVKAKREGWDKKRKTIMNNIRIEWLIKRSLFFILSQCVYYHQKKILKGNRHVVEV